VKAKHDITDVRALALEDVGPAIECCELPPFESDDLEDIRRAFESAMPIPFRQAWLESEEFHFAPGEVRVGWRGSSLLVFAELNDTFIFNHASDHNQQMWLLGDTFEIFLRPAEQETYVEFHVTPNNHRLQLRYESTDAAALAKQNGCIRSALMHAPMFKSVTWVQDEAERWFVFAEISARSVIGRDVTLSGQRWRFSFGRYDYQRDREQPVLSSTSLHAEPDFHRLEEWGTLIFNRLFES
jgi:hypothetical protein